MWTSRKTDFRSSKNNFRGHDISRPTPWASLSVPSFSLGLYNRDGSADKHVTYHPLVLFLLREVLLSEPNQRVRFKLNDIPSEFKLITPLLPPIMFFPT